MILWLVELLTEFDSAFRVFRYITLRSVFGALTALMMTLFLGPYIIRRLRVLKWGQVVREDGPVSHYKKQNTPTMGGLLMLVSILISCLIWADVTMMKVLYLLFAITLFAGIGMYDDYQKITKHDAEGIRARVKFLLQTIAALVIVVLLYYTSEYSSETQYLVPMLKGIMLDLGPLFMVISYLVIVASVNSVNMTDGLDGLVLIPSILIMTALTVFAYVAGNTVVADYLNLPFIPNMGEVAIFGAAYIGACLGFLWYNTYPADIFMGDTGSMMLGAGLGLMAILVRQEIVYFVMSGVFVAETLSVIIQVGCYKMYGIRVFRMAPLHHHFELMGVPEPKVIVRFWIVTLILVLIGMATLKIR
ncbi:MAG: phospho-N-acetylmuramoyl-pentapeptide-transferase [Gammaproteobacteria bacterium]|nr:phospho-N-acetylmuramoyl-pentapeptide-transferase [Gammaproteobacteria bacterium]